MAGQRTSLDSAVYLFICPRVTKREVIVTHHRFAVQAPDSDLDAPTPSMEDAANRRSALVEHLGFTEAEATAFLNGDREILRSVAARRMHRQSGLTLVDNDLMG